MTGDDLQDRLEAVGAVFDLSEYEIEAYLAVLQHGRLTASAIADRTAIPQPRVYDTVRSLADKGLVELRESRPMAVLAVDPEEAFAGVESAVTTLVDDLATTYTAPARETEAVSLVTSKQTILRNLEDVIATAEYELVLSLTPTLLGRYEADLRDRRAADVSIDLLLSPAADVPSADAYAYDRVATTTRVRRGVTTPIVAVADGRYSIYTVREALQDGADRYGVLLNRSELGGLLSGFLTTAVWSSATTLAEDEAERSFPRRYATIRRCVRELSETTDDDLYATVRGRDVTTGEPTTVGGRIVSLSVGTNRETAAMTLAHTDGETDVGGQAAAFEDVEAREIAVGRDGPPEL